MSKSPVKPPNYSQAKFVDRDKERNLVRAKAQSLRDGQLVDKRTIIFVGGRGIGKSWLLACLRDDLAESGLATCSLDLRKHADQDPTFAALETLQEMADRLPDKSKLVGVTLVEKSRGAVEQVRRLLKKQPLVLLIDWVYESGWDLLKLLEEYLLGPLANEPRVLIVMAGRGREYLWRTPALRLRAEFCDLKGFALGHTTEQLKLQKSNAVARATQIHQLSSGNPLTNYLLAVSKDLDQALDLVINGMLETVPQHDRSSLREYLEALCVLQSFDEERIPVMLAAYYDSSQYRNWSYGQARQVREKITRWVFASWNEEHGGYVMDASTRDVIEKYIRAADSSMWRALHCAAYRLYKDWLKYPNAAERWQPEVNYHADQLRQAKLGPDECSIAEQA